MNQQGDDILQLIGSKTVSVNVSERPAARKTVILMLVSKSLQNQLVWFAVKRFAQGHTR